MAAVTTRPVASSMPVLVPPPPAKLSTMISSKQETCAIMRSFPLSLILYIVSLFPYDSADNFALEFVGDETTNEQEQQERRQKIN